MLAVGLLKKWGHSVVVSHNGRQAVDCLEREPFDLVLMDVQMPEMDGLTAAQLIRRRERDGDHWPQQRSRLPIIAMTAHAMKGDRERCLQAGMDDYVSKPIRAGELQTAIARSLEPDTGTIPQSQDALARPIQAAADPVDWSLAMATVEGDRELLQEVIDAFLEECPRHLQQLCQAWATGDAATVARLGHLIRGACRTFGAEDVRRIAEVIESQGRAGQLTDAKELVDGLDAALQDLIQSLQTAESRVVPPKPDRGPTSGS